MDIFGFLRSFQLNIERIVLGMFNNIIDRFQIQNNFLFVEIDDMPIVYLNKKEVVLVPSAPAACSHHFGYEP